MIAMVRADVASSLTITSSIREPCLKYGGFMRGVADEWRRVRRSWIPVAPILRRSEGDDLGGVRFAGNGDSQSAHDSPRWGSDGHSTVDEMAQRV